MSHVEYDMGAHCARRVIVAVLSAPECCPYHRINVAYEDDRRR